MFTGLISDIGKVRELRAEGGLLRLQIEAPRLSAGLQAGDSVAVNGVCLTVTGLDTGGFWTEAMSETVRLTTLPGWRAGRPVNLERAVRLDGFLDGHLVSGHVDGTAVVETFVSEGSARRLAVRTAGDLCRYIAVKGSVALDGVSLTVAAVSPPERFEVALIPTTLQQTTLGQCEPGCRINLEVDLLARYLERLLESRWEGRGVTAERLRQAGF